MISMMVLYRAIDIVVIKHDRRRSGLSNALAVMEYDNNSIAIALNILHKPYSHIHVRLCIVHLETHSQGVDVLPLLLVDAEAGDEGVVQVLGLRHEVSRAQQVKTHAVVVVFVHHGGF